MAQQNKLGTVATTKQYISETDTFIIRYHQTAIVTVTEKSILLDNGGWFTATTKTRMNQASNQFDLGYRVYQQKSEWFVEYKGNVYPFDGILELGR